MFNPINFISKFIKSSNKKELDRIDKIVRQINSLEDEFKDLQDLDFPKKTLEFKEKIKQGKLSKKPGYKKAIITLKKGQSIDLTTGI